MNSERLRIVFLDDDGVFLSGAAAWLKARGWSVLPARCPEEATRLLDQEPPVDLLLADIHLPNQRPLQWVEETLARPECPPIFLVTGAPSFETACRAANLPIAGYLLKPLDLPKEEPRLRAAALARRHRIVWRDAVHETIDVLRKTKRAFHSKELGALRAKLQQLDGAASRDA